MKKGLLIPALLLHLLLYSQDKTKTLQSENIKGNVVSYSQKIYKIIGSSKDLTPKYIQSHIFDKKGNLRRIDNIDENAKVISKEIYSYLSKKLTKVATVNSIGKTNQTIIFEYDEAGNLSFEKKYNNQAKLQYKISYFYDKNDQLKSLHKLIPSINYTIKESYKYNNKNELIEQSKTARIGTTKENYKYNDKGLLTKKLEYNAMGELFKVTSYVYNEQNDQLSFKQLDSDGVLIYSEKYEYLYDQNGNWIEKTYYINGTKDSKEIREINYY